MRKKIRWGILSTAAIGKSSIIPVIKSVDNSEVVAVASRSLEKAKTFATELDIPKAYGSYEELLTDPNIDAIYNPLPISLHLEWSIKCAEANKPVLCEKPMAPNSKEVEEMIAIFFQKKLLLAEALMYRYHPLTKKFLSLVRGGTIGEIQTIQSHFDVDIPNKNDIRFRKETGGGSLLDLGVYCVSIIRRIANEEPIDVKSFAKLNDEGVDTSFTGIMKFPSNILGHFDCSLTSQFSCGYSAIGTKGKLLVDHGGMVPWAGEEFRVKHWSGEEYKEFIIPSANHYELMIEDFSNALLNGTQLEFDLQDSISNAKVMDALLDDT